MLRIVPIYAAILAVVFVLLAIRVIRTRGAERIAIGTGRSRVLERRVRAHANFAEYVPFALLLLAMAELRGAAAAALHILCLLLLAGRLLHAWGLVREPEPLRFRIGGIIATFTSIIGAAGLIAAT